MPIYEYRCKKCGQVSEFFVKQVGAEPDDLRCSKCGSTEMVKMLSTMAVHGGAGGDGACPTGQCPLTSSCPTCDGSTCPL